jgi:signal transduction histidine kinase
LPGAGDHGAERGSVALHVIASLRQPEPASTEPFDADPAGVLRHLACDLHDGVLQSLAAAGMHLEGVRQLIGADPVAAAARVIEIEQILAAQQRDLRSLIRALRTGQQRSPVPAASLAAALRHVCSTAGLQWRVIVRLSTPQLCVLPADLASEVERIVQEALANVGKHAHARRAAVSVRLGHDEVEIVVTDDGIGFAFHGRHDMRALAPRGLGPVSLYRRVRALHGELTVTSGEWGSRIELRLPVGEQR